MNSETGYATAGKASIGDARYDKFAGAAQSQEFTTTKEALHRNASKLHPDEFRENDLARMLERLQHSRALVSELSTRIERVADSVYGTRPEAACGDARGLELRSGVMGSLEDALDGLGFMIDAAIRRSAA